MITSLPSERESNCGNIWDIFSPVQKVGIFQQTLEFHDF
jgi:hypothetical protein